MLSVMQLTKSFGMKKALETFDLVVGQGEVVGVLGPNGSGKSTLMKIVAGLIKKNKGRVEIEGDSPSSITKAKVSYLSDTNDIPGSFSIKEVMDFYDHFYNDFDKEVCLKNLEALRLSNELQTKNKKLSKGMQQKLRLALTMARKAKLYLLDEPLGGIDPLAREEILDTLIDNMDEDATMVITTHLVSEVEQVLTRVVFIHEGKCLGDYDCETVRFQQGVSIEDKYKEVFRDA